MPRVLFYLLKHECNVFVNAKKEKEKDLGTLREWPNLEGRGRERPSSVTTRVTRRVFQERSARLRQVGFTRAVFCTVCASVGHRRGNEDTILVHAGKTRDWKDGEIQKKKEKKKILSLSQAGLTSTYRASSTCTRYRAYLYSYEYFFSTKVKQSDGRGANAP